MTTNTNGSAQTSVSHNVTEAPKLNTSDDYFSKSHNSQSTRGISTISSTLEDKTSTSIILTSIMTSVNGHTSNYFTSTSNPTTWAEETTSRISTYTSTGVNPSDFTTVFSHTADYTSGISYTENDVNSTWMNGSYSTEFTMDPISDQGHGDLVVIISAGLSGGVGLLLFSTFAYYIRKCYVRRQQRRSSPIVRASDVYIELNPIGYVNHAARLETIPEEIESSL